VTPATVTDLRYNRKVANTLHGNKLTNGRFNNTQTFGKQMHETAKHTNVYLSVAKHHKIYKIFSSQHYAIDPKQNTNIECRGCANPVFLN